MNKCYTTIVFVGAAVALGYSAVALAQAPTAIVYNGDLLPSSAAPAWLSSGDVSAGTVVSDSGAEDGWTYALTTTGSGAWSMALSELALLDNVSGWELEIGHKAISNQFGDMERKFTNDDTDHLRISDGFLTVRVSFRPGQVRIDSGRVATWFCSDIPSQCRLFSVPLSDYVTVRIVAQENSYVATVNGEHFVGQHDRTIPKLLAFGNSSGTADSKARWDYVRLFMGERDADGDGVKDELDVCSETSVPESLPTERLGANRFALTDDDGVFNTTSPLGGGGPGLVFTIEETAGCSCEQIVDALGLGRGHEKFGCSISAMEAWVALVNP